MYVCPAWCSDLLHRQALSCHCVSSSLLGLLGLIAFIDLVALTAHAVDVVSFLLRFLVSKLLRLHESSQLIRIAANPQEQSAN